MEKVWSVIKQMKWKAHFYLRKDKSNIAYTKYGFKTRTYPLQFRDLQEFEKDLLDTIKLMKFWNDKRQTNCCNFFSFIPHYCSIYYSVHRTLFLVYNINITIQYMCVYRHGINIKTSQSNFFSVVRHMNIRKLLKTLQKLWNTSCVSFFSCAVLDFVLPF